ncbi:MULTISPECIES: Gfo/Idh/MocA family oxidoreductase [unclassified Pseudomonas]|uniref:Gfo/Idh/MocA family oxidoreductase n=1 Tax=unclassified Pseudomonas TaxID=196821 RepID=UPI000876807A|nr:MULTISPECIES: Gfo/Idh/MocA family oxidoreductase [unclassified Pseudomonas]SCZ27876.1 Oxidoreductase family, NAD-binding Rossmann fold [Pseudomonas sp. NFACC44-2]SDA75584.1 Oxidoreductase family, NAD-binding Rossmann fold [Pseudomonas sp. NFACC51]SEJ31064.1 Oxidoreductase family, NAD-binding Rossmann fold [Pseudomonas sp. NFACC07-1]SFH43634.1 Oxidoreductase family, NAD-binding Rossmann fold [Pseudomonas sp. NFACC54]SFT15370.1 Oxidoreductase family, NAD-binding Rossmann fold [Pseudomonas sp.
MSQANQVKSNYLLVGAGQLGTRHLQALVGHAPGPITIQVVDPFETSLMMARERAEAVKNSDGYVELSYLSKLEHILPTIDFSVIATNANCRLDVIEQVLAKSLVRYLVLEKVLFQSADQLDQAVDLIERVGTVAYVNCPRRMFPIYRELREHLKDAKQVVLSVEGDDWGLACNAIHFIDLWAFLTGCTDYEVDVSALDSTILDSKREGYKEVTGVVRGHAAGHAFHLVSRAMDTADKEPLRVRVETEQLVIDIFESKGICRIVDLARHSEQEQSFSIPYQSQLTHLVADSLLQHGQCELTPFKESVALHKPLLKALLAFFNEYDDVVRDHCPIT